MSKIFFEYIGVKLSKSLGPDAMPVFYFGAAYAYEVNMSIALAGNIHWAVAVELIAFDVVENIYLLSCLKHFDNDEEKDDVARRKLYILSSLLLREFVEICVPAQLFLELSLIKRFKPEFSTLLCERTAE